MPQDRVRPVHEAATVRGVSVPVSDAARRSPAVLRLRLHERVLATPPGGALMVVAPRGHGARSLLDASLGGGATVVAPGPEVTSGAQLTDLVAAALGGDPGDLPGALAGSDRPWLAVVGLDGSTQGDLLEALAELVRRCPADRRIAVATTDDPRSAFAPLRLEGRVVELDASDLAFVGDEALGLLDGYSPGLPAELAARLVVLCDGWAAALVAAATQWRDRPDHDVVTWLRTYGAEALVGPWLDQQAADVREMLLDTAILEQLTPDLVEAVTLSTTADALPRLARPGGLLRVSDATSESELVWFERHPLLTSLVRYRAGSRSPAQVRHLRAAEWFRARGDLGDELLHLLVAGDSETASARFLTTEDELLVTGRARLALQWYETTPEEERSAEDLMRRGWACALSDRLVDASIALNRVRSGLELAVWEPMPDPDVFDVEAEADLLDAWLGEQAGDVVRMRAAAGRARGRFSGGWSRNSHQLAPLLEARALLLLGEPGEADGLLATVRESPYVTDALGEGRRAEVESATAWGLGHVPQARSWAARHDRWIRAQDPDRLHPRFGPCVVGLLCLAEDGRLDEARAGLEAAVARATAGEPQVTDLVVALLALARTEALDRRLRAALEHAAAARAAVLQSSPSGGLLPTVTAMQARLRLMAGDQVRAERLVRELPAGAQRQLLLARLALLRGQPVAPALVREVEPRTAREDVERSVLAAWANLSSSQAQAEVDLLRAADVAGQHGLRTVLVDAPEPLLQAARRAATHHVHDVLLDLVRTAARARAAGDRATAEPRKEPQPPDRALTRGELQLLALLPSRAVNARIADELGVSVNTVKTRLRRLYVKLGVHERDDAVARATELGLLGGRAGG